MNKKKALLALLFFNLFILNYIAINTQGLTIDVSDDYDYSKEDSIPPNETIKYNFPKNIIFQIKSNISANLSLNFQNLIYNRQISLQINNSKPYLIEMNSKTDLEDFSLPQIPNKTDNQNYVNVYRYNFLNQFQSNTSLDFFSVRFLISEDYGLKETGNYSLVLIDSEKTSWEYLSTKKVESEEDDFSYLEGQVSDFEGGEDYYITIVETIKRDDDDGINWIFILLIVLGLGLLGLAGLVLSKSDYIQYLKKKITSPDKGKHELSLEEVLKNKNRSKIIDLILKKPGIHYNELLRETGLAPGNLVWHLEILENYEVIGKKAVGNYVVYFPYYRKNPISNIDLILEKSDLSLKVLKNIENNPGIWNKKITKKLERNRKTIQYHIDKLIDLGLVVKKKDGRKNKLFPNLDSEYFSEEKKDVKPEDVI
ncbi:MAG: winged helix-turn-helix transcriptional regulator [Promethearchaeia archaeon]